MYGVRTRRLLQPLVRALGGARHVPIARELSDLQWEPTAVLLERAEQKIARVLRHACDNVPLYEDEYRAHGSSPDAFKSLPDLQRFPIITKAALRKRYPEGVVARNVEETRLVSVRTSGTSGTPFQFFLDKASELTKQAHRVLVDSWAGLEAGEKWVRIGAMRNNLSLVGRLKERYVGMEYLVAALETRIDSEDTVRRMAAWKPSYIWGFSTYLVALAEFIRERRLEFGPLKAVIVTSENLSPGGRAVIEEVFCCPVFSRYVSTELGGNYVQDCELHRGLHFNSEMVFFEVVDEAGGWVQPGEMGRLVATDLLNYAAPLVRYYTGDLAVAGAECECGRGFPVLAHIEGRESETIRLSDGKLVSPTALGEYLIVQHDYLSFVSTYQLVRTSQTDVILRVVPAHDVDPQALAQAWERLEKDAAGLLAGMRVKVEVVADIPLEPSGKRLIIKDQTTAP